MAEALRLRSPTRNAFLREIVECAKAFLKRNKKDFKMMQRRAREEEEREAKGIGNLLLDPLTKGNWIAKKFATCLKSEVHKLFDLIYASNLFYRGEVIYP